MNRDNSKASNALGFISVVTDESGRRIGGLLVINASGRPLEFHCTAPVKSNRAQEILYGPTLDEYLFGEQIGQALHQAMKSDARVLFADSPHVLALRHLVKQPVVPGGKTLLTLEQVNHQMNLQVLMQIKMAS